MVKKDETLTVDVAGMRKRVQDALIKTESKIEGVELLAGEGVSLDYAPGNGTVYSIMAIQLTGINLWSEEKLVTGYVKNKQLGEVSEGGWLIICGLTRKAALFQPTGILTDDYVAEKFELRMPDARPVAKMLRAILGRESDEQRGG